MLLRVIILGPPGSGKSTLTSGLLREYPGLVRFGVRAYFAREIKQSTDLGEKARPFVERRLWLPDELVIEAVRREFLAGTFDHGFIFEGLPANRNQAALLDQLMKDLHIQGIQIIYFDASDDLCVQRADKRRVCTICDGGVNQAILHPELKNICAVCGSQVTVRPDDNEEAFRARLQVHRTMVNDIMQYYSDLNVVHLNGHLSAAQILSLACKQLSTQEK